jgi:uncharacterized protein YndB with AHSA1/START domain
MTNNFLFEPDLAAKKIHIVREFNAPVEKVWKAFTVPGLFVKWTAPKPWTAEIKTWDFTVDGISLYAMVSPEGLKQWVFAQFTAIENGIAFSSTGMFCDGDGNPVTDGPKSYRDTQFSSIDDHRSKIDMVITFEEESTIKWFVEGGFKEGTVMTFDQLDALLAAEQL